MIKYGLQLYCMWNVFDGEHPNKTVSVQSKDSSHPSQYAHLKIFCII